MSESEEIRFRIVESSSNDDMYDIIKKDIKKGLLVREIRDKHNIGNGKWLKYRKQLIEEGLIDSIPSRIANAKYYYFNNHKKCWVVKKRIDGVDTQFYSGQSEEDCKNIVEKLKEYGWDRTLMPRIKGELGLC